MAISPRERMVALRGSGCGVGVGTVYNYFPSKENLLASYLLSDWRSCVAAIRAASQKAETPRPVLESIYSQLLAFSGRHQAIFQDAEASAAFAGSFSKYHGLLRSQLAEPLQKFCKSDFTAEFIAESLLTWTMAGKTLDEICGIVEKLF